MEEKKFSLKEASLTFLLAFVLCQAFVFVGQILINLILSTIGYSSEKITSFVSSPFGYFLLACFQFTSFVAVFIYCYKKTDLKENFSKNKKISWNILLFVAVGIVVMFCLSYFINYFTTLINLNGNTSSSLPYQINTPAKLILSVISLAVLPGIGEELLFRATILNGLKKKSKLFALLVSSLFFTIFHFNISQLFYPFLFGLLLGVVYLLTDNIAYPIIIHFSNNALNLMLQYFSSGSYFEISSLNFVLMICGIVIFLIILAVLFYKLYKKEVNLQNKVIENQTTEQTNIKKPIENNQNNDKTIETLKFLWPILVMIIFYIINVV